jgi:hypothetical protein
MIAPGVLLDRVTSLDYPRLCEYATTRHTRDQQPDTDHHTSVYIIDREMDRSGVLTEAYDNMWDMLSQNMRAAPSSNLRIEYGVVVRRPRTPPAPIHPDGGYGIVLLYLHEAPGPLIFGVNDTKTHTPVPFMVGCGSRLYMDPDVWHCSPGNNTDLPVMMLYLHARKCHYICPRHLQ